MTAARPGLATTLDWLSTATSARLTNSLLWGRDNYPLDRRLVAAVDEAIGPDRIRGAAVGNLAFAAATARWAAAERGVRQFLDLGCGYPVPTAARTVGDNIHRTIADICPGAPVVYVDRDPIVMPHCRAGLPADGPPHQVTCVQADILTMGRLLADPALNQALDTSRPIAVSAHDVLPWISDDDAVRHSMRLLRAWLPPGSLLSITHYTPDWHPHDLTTVARLCTDHGLPLHPRTRTRITRFFGDWTVLGGLTALRGRRPTARGSAHLPPDTALACAGIAVKRTP